MKAEDFDFEENSEDLPMFKELTERNNQGLIVESASSEARTGSGGRYTVAYKKMEGQGHLEEPLLQNEEETKIN